MTDQMEMERLLKLEAFRSDFNRLSNGNSDSKKTNPIFDQLNSDNLLTEIKDPMVGEVWDDTKRLIDLADKVQTNEDLVEIEAKTRLVIEKIKGL